MNTINKHWISLALAFIAALALGSNRDGWGWCLFIIFLIES